MYDSGQLTEKCVRLAYKPRVAYSDVSVLGKKNWAVEAYNHTVVNMAYNDSGVLGKGRLGQL
jgi:hypothetical protein